jgi:hypothetical protein
MQYSTLAFIESLRQEKHGLVTYLIDSPTDIIFGWIFKCGPLIIFKIRGWNGEKATIVNIFNKEFVF